MRPIVQTISAPGSLIIPLDFHQNPGSVYIDVTVIGTVSYGVQASNDDPFSGSAPTNFTTVPPIAAATAAAAQATISGAIPRQLYVTLASGSGSITVRVIQAGVMG